MHIGCVCVCREDGRRDGHQSDWIPFWLLVFVFFIILMMMAPPNCWEGIDDTKMHLVNELRDADLSLSAFHPGEHSI